MELVLGLFGFIFIIVTFFAMFKIFDISTNLYKLNKNVSDFTKYYYQLQDFKHTKETPQAITPEAPPKFRNYDPAIFEKPIDEKLSQHDYELIYTKDNERFMNIANYFYKNDVEFYNAEILPIMKNNRQ